MLPSRSSSPCSTVDELAGCATSSFYLAGDSQAMQRLRSQLVRIAPYLRTALITGEVGTGKQTVARALHQAGRRAEGPFVILQAAPLLDESELRLAVHGAVGGTLFIEDVERLSSKLQAVLLRMLLPDVRRKLRVDLRVIAASAFDLRSPDAMGQLERQLSRMFAAEVRLVALRRRPGDISSLAERLLRELAPEKRIDTKIIVEMTAYEWPGNVGELRRFLVQAAKADGAILAWTPPERVEEPAVPPFETLQAVSRRHVLDVMDRCAGNKLRSAELLGISRSTLYRMLDAQGEAG